MQTYRAVEVDEDARAAEDHQHNMDLIRGTNVILLSKHGDKIRAELKGKPQVWGCADTSDGAIGALVTAHPEKFKIRVEQK